VALRVWYEGSCNTIPYGIVSCCCGRQGFGERQRGTTCTVWRKLQHYTICCKKSQSYAPKNGRKSVRNMLSWSQRSINCYCCI